MMVPILATSLMTEIPAAPVAAAPKALSTPKDVTGIKVTPVTVAPRPEWTATDQELNEEDLPPDPPDPGGALVVDLVPAAATSAARSTARKPIRAGMLPVYLAAAPGLAASAAADRAAPLPLRRVHVEILNHKATLQAGVKGMVVQLARADGVNQASQTTMTVDYRSVPGLFGGDARTRLRLVRLSDGRTVPSVNDAMSGTLSATVSLPASGAASSFAVSAAPEGENGDYKATSLTPSSTWQVSQQTGAFSWTYPIKVPAPTGDMTPSLSLSYSSGSIDGRTSANNTQASWAGDGWEMWPGFIERSYRECTDDHDEQEKKDPNNKDQDGGDLCYFNDNATMSFNGSATELVKVPASENDDDKDKTVLYRGVSDEGSIIEMVKDGRDNGDVDGSFWRMTTLNGTQYYFGKDKGEGGSSAATRTSSVWSVPVYSNHPDEPGYDKDFSKSRHDRAWRWNLDYAVDPSGNTVTYFYQKESGAYAREHDGDKRSTYDRGGYLTRVEYGSRRDAAASVRPAARVVFDTRDRCLGTCLNSAGGPIVKRFPDTPWELYCDKAPCKTEFSPTFWTQKRLAKITTQVYAGAGDSYTDVDSWTLAHTYLQAGGNESTPMWLKSITHAGMVTTAGGPAVTEPAVVFNPNADVMPNRVDTPNGHSSLFRSRINTITTESGAQYGITYSKPECNGKPLPMAWSNTKRCYPQFYGAEGETPKIDWFNKYVVNRVDVYDNTGGFEHQQSNYDYLDTPAWAYDDSELVKPKKRTWGQFRGYGRVVVRQGVESGVQSKTEYRYFRGMDGDKQPKTDESPPTGTPRNVQVSDSLGGAIDDHRAYAGMLREQIDYNGLSGDWISGLLNTPARRGPTASYGSLQAWKVNTETTRSRMKLSNGNTRWMKTVTRVNDDNLPVEVDDLGDESTPTDDQCVRSEYATNGAGMRDRVKRVETVGVSCDAETERPRVVLSDARTYYDNPDNYGQSPVRGLPVRSEELDGWDGSRPTYVTTARTAYDEIGRITSQSDALNRTTVTAYTPAVTGPVTQIQRTDPASHTTTATMNPALGVPVKSVGPNGTVTQLTYDGVGRLLAVWAPGRSSSAFPKDPSVSYAYGLRKTAASSVTTKTLTPYGSKNYRTSVTLYDGLLRERQTQTQTVAGGRAITESVYDSRGLLEWASNPYYDIDNTAPQETLVTARGRPEIPALTRNVYDGVGRLTAAALIVNGDEKWRTTTQFNGEKTSVTPPDGGTATTTVTDARGRQTELRQYKDPTKVGGDDSSTFDRTAYTYTPRGEPASIVGLGGNTWSFGYDLRGRKVSTGDPDNGSNTFGYDAAGQLDWSKDARGRVLAYSYDTLGRKTAVRQTSHTGPKLAEWEYDTLARGIGKLSRSTRYEYDPAGNASAYTEAITGYDNGGLPTGSSVTIPASESGLCVSGTLQPCTFTISQFYRPDGTPNQTVYPAVAGLPAETLSTQFNEVGLSDGLFGNLSYAQDVIYNQLDQLIGRNLGEHNTRVGLTYDYDEPTGRLKTFTAAPELKTDIYHLDYTYNNAGTLTAISDTPDGGQPAETQCFSYDHLARLTEAWTPTSRLCATTPSPAALGGPAPYWRSYTYDGSGNRKTEVAHATTNTTSTYAYPNPAGPAGSKPHAVTAVTNSGANTVTKQYAYDQAGNVVCRPTGATGNACGPEGIPGADSQALTWNDEGHVTKTTDKTGDTSYVYDADGNRIIRRDPAGATLYLPGGTEIRKPKTGAAVGTRYYSHLGTTIAVRTAAGVTWMVNDLHGTGAATISNDQTLAVTRRRTLPFGDIRGTAPSLWAGDKGFVGGTQDNTGLTHLGAREYDPSLGRFASVDPLMDLANPQQWNGYNYANDNPINGSDPTGLMSTDCIGVDCHGHASPTLPPGGGANHDNSGSAAPTQTITSNVTEVQCHRGESCTRADGAKYTCGRGTCAWTTTHGGRRAVQGQGPVGGIAPACQDGGTGECEKAGMWTALLVIDAAASAALEIVLLLDPIPGDEVAFGGATAAGAKGISNRISAAEARATRAAAHCDSFAADTEVLMADRTHKPIKNVEVGDYVLATDPETGETTAEKVTKLHDNIDNNFVDVNVVGARGRVATLHTTKNHPFWDRKTHKWINATDLQPGDVLRTVGVGPARVTRVHRFTASRHMLNLTVNNLHTYYVLAGNTPVLVHNQGELDPGQIYLYRAVQGSELNDIHSTRSFRSPDGGPKYFSFTERGAAEYARRAYGAYPSEGPYNIVRTVVNRADIPASAVMPHTADVVDGGVALGSDDLSKLGRPRIMPSMSTGIGC